jgi:hypothetical protein
MHGSGVHLTEQGDRYKGNHRKGLRHGQGSLQAADGSHYSGEWKVRVSCVVVTTPCPAHVPNLGRARRMAVRSRCICVVICVF